MKNKTKTHANVYILYKNKPYSRTLNVLNGQTLRTWYGFKSIFRKMNNLEWVTTDNTVEESG